MKFLEGDGYIAIPNGLSIPDMPLLNKSLPSQHAMISVFPKLHCLVTFSSLQSYFQHPDLPHPIAHETASIPFKKHTPTSDLKYLTKTDIITQYTVLTS